MLQTLLGLYLPFIGWGCVGWVLGRVVPAKFPPLLGVGLFWVGVPILIFTFMRQAHLSAELWLAGIVGIGVVTTGLLLGIVWLWATGQTGTSLAERQARGSFLLTATMGNTGYIGYPVILALVGARYFGWAVFYDVASTLWSNAQGTVIASWLGQGQVRWGRLVRDVTVNPILLAFTFSYFAHDWPVPSGIMTLLKTLAWTVIPLTLILLGMRLQQVQNWQRLPDTLPALLIKIILVPLGLLLVGRGLGWQGKTLEVLLLQAAMPSAFSSLLLSEAYQLDRELTALTIALSTLGVMATIPVWLWLAG